MRWLIVAMLVGCVIGCGTEPLDTIEHDDAVDDPELPPRGMTVLEPWLAAGYHKGWHCEPAPRPAHDGSPHAGARVCSNEAIATAPEGSVPVGSATVKEIYTADGVLLGHAVSRKVTDEGPDGWYWYEFHSNNLFNDGMNNGSCPLCHVSAASEFTFVIVR